MTEFNFSGMQDDDLRLLHTSTDAGPDQAKITEEIGRRASNYAKEADDILAQNPLDFELAMEKLDKAYTLSGLPLYKGARSAIEKKQQEHRQSHDLLDGLINRLMQREDMKELKRTVEYADKLRIEGKLPDSMKESLEAAKKVESEHRASTGKVTTNARTGNMVGAREAYLSLRDNKSSQVWDDLAGGYVDSKSDAFKSLVSRARQQWELETNKAIQEFITDPDGSYQRLDEDPGAAEAALNRNFSPHGIDLIFPDCAEKFENLKNEIFGKARSFRTADGLYKESETLADKVEAYDKVIEAFKVYKLKPEKDEKKIIAEARINAQNYVFRSLSGNIAQAVEYIEGFDFNGFERLVAGTWERSKTLEAIQNEKDDTLRHDSEEIKAYIKRKEVSQKELEALSTRCSKVKKNYNRIDEALKTFEDVIFTQDARSKIKAAETWKRLEKFLGEEAALLGAGSQSKNYVDHFKGRIEKIKNELIPLLGDEQQLDLIREGEDTPERWPDILKTNPKFRRKYPEADDIYERVFKQYNLVELEAGLRADDFVTARKCLNALIQQDVNMSLRLEDQEKKIKKAEEATTTEVETFYRKASALSENQEISDLIAGWKMLRQLTPEGYQEGADSKWPALSEKCIYVGQSRRRIVEIETRLKGEAKRVSEQAKSWTASGSENQDFPREKKGIKGGKPETDKSLTRTARDIGFLRENNFLNFEQTLDCKVLELWDARQRADQYVVAMDFKPARAIWQKMSAAYGREVENDVIRLGQNELLHLLTEKLNKKDYQGAINEVNRVEQENMVVVALCYPIRIKHALAFEGLKQYEQALEKLDDIRPDLLHLDPEDIRVIEAERSRLLVENEIHKGTTAYEQAVIKLGDSNTNEPGFFIASLTHLAALKNLSQKHAGNKDLNVFLQGELDSRVTDLLRLIERNKNIPQKSVQRDVFLYRLCLREFKNRFTINLAADAETLINFGEDKKRNISAQDKLHINTVWDYIKDQFEKVNPKRDNGTFNAQEAERQAGSLSALDLSGLMLGYHEQFNMLLTLGNVFDSQIMTDLEAKAGEALFMADKLRELCERAEVETSWVYTLRNGYASAFWKAHFNGRVKNSGGESIVKIKTRHAYIQANFLNDKVIELDEFNKKYNDAEQLKPILKGKINNIASGYSAYLTAGDNSDWTVSTQIEEILFVESAIPKDIRNQLNLKEEMRELYPKIISFYDDVIEFPARDPKWGWKGFSEGKEKALQIESNIKAWQDWSKGVGFAPSKDKISKPDKTEAWHDWVAMDGQLKDYASAYSFADWASKSSTTVPWPGDDKERMQQAAMIVKEKNWYLQVFEEVDPNKHFWEVDPPEGDRFQFNRYLFQNPLPQTYQLWLWRNVLLKNMATNESVERGPAKGGSHLESYTALVPAAQEIKAQYQDILVKLADQKTEIGKIIELLEKARETFPSLKDLNNFLNNKQFDLLEKKIKAAKLIGPGNKQEAGYLWSTEQTMEDFKKNRGCLVSLFGRNQKEA